MLSPPSSGRHADLLDSCVSAPFCRKSGIIVITESPDDLESGSKSSDINITDPVAFCRTFGIDTTDFAKKTVDSDSESGDNRSVSIADGSVNDSPHDWGDDMENHLNDYRPLTTDKPRPPCRCHRPMEINEHFFNKRCAFEAETWTAGVAYLRIKQRHEDMTRLLQVMQVYLLGLMSKKDLLVGDYVALSYVKKLAHLVFVAGVREEHWDNGLVDHMTGEGPCLEILSTPDVVEDMESDDVQLLLDAMLIQGDTLTPEAVQALRDRCSDNKLDQWHMDVRLSTGNSSLLLGGHFGGGELLESVQRFDRVQTQMLELVDDALESLFRCDPIFIFVRGRFRLRATTYLDENDLYTGSSIVGRCVNEPRFTMGMEELQKELFELLPFAQRHTYRSRGNLEGLAFTEELMFNIAQAATRAAKGVIDDFSVVKIARQFQKMGRVQPSSWEYVVVFVGCRYRNLAISKICQRDAERGRYMAKVELFNRNLRLLKHYQRNPQLEPVAETEVYPTMVDGKPKRRKVICLGPEYNSDVEPESPRSKRQRLGDVDADVGGAGSQPHIEEGEFEFGDGLGGLTGTVPAW